MRRSRFLGLAAAGAFAGSWPHPLGARPRPYAARRRASATTLAKAYRFLADMMDRYASGATTRLVQSYVPTKALNLGDIGYTYDSDVVTIALLTRGSSDDLARATVLGDSLLYAQAHDPIGDGRVRDGYHVDPFVRKNGTLRIGFSDGDGGSDCGNMAWTGLALARCAAILGTARHLDGALAIGEWVQANAYDTRGAGGYTGGISQRQRRIMYKATEHNIDLYGLFTMLAALSGQSVWAERAQWALGFVVAMWNANGGFFWTETLDDGVTINKSFIPEDVQSWSYLATLDPSHEGSIDWAQTNLSASDGPFEGVSLSNADRSGVWFEGTAHMAAALLARNRSGDPAKAQAYLESIALAQTEAPNEDGLGIDAASKDGLRTGDGDKYYAALHIGATSWYCIALQNGNPLRLRDVQRLL